MRIVDSSFNKSAVYPKDYPNTSFAEIAFVGKSNVGKSSLINTILNRKGLAKTSSRPGKTRLINFFDIRFEDNKEERGSICFVDLPGYGYAKVPQSEKNLWKKMINMYFEERIQLRGVIVLVDSRRKPDPKDLVVIQMLISLKIPFCIVATKADKLKKSKRKNTITKLNDGLGLKQEKIITFSSTKKIGIDSLLNWISETIL
ncbi:MAG: ribosome biogenesis GTP-binding protein YihA/YsxC [Candidatus Cloacimonadota bacterium]|nr:ribosome biogenesis GTP-binding protein YihA/YsxC [Candidatus Cloacimonadota bacterium]